MGDDTRLVIKILKEAMKINEAAEKMGKAIYELRVDLESHYEAFGIDPRKAKALAEFHKAVDDLQDTLIKANDEIVDQAIDVLKPKRGR